MTKKTRITLEWALQRMNELRRLEQRPLHTAKYAPRGSTGEVALWRAVVLQALLDATTESAKPEMRMERHRASNWLTIRTPDFRTVCDLAHLDAAQLEKLARALLEQSESKAPHSEPA